MTAPSDPSDTASSNELASPAPADKNDNETAKLTRGSIAAHLIEQTTPAIAGVAAMTSISLVDSYFIGQLGSTELAAISLVFPIMVAISSLGVGVMAGVNSVVARSLGAGDNASARDQAKFGILFAAVIGLVFAGALFLAAETVFVWMHADAQTLPLIMRYIQITAAGLPLLLITMGINGAMRAQGEARKTLMVSLTFAGTNWVLDPILITGAFGFPAMGVAGAAWATVIGWLLGTITAFLLLRKTPLSRLQNRAHNGPGGEAETPLGARAVKAIGAILKITVPASLSNAINPLGLAVLTALVALEGQAALAGFGAAGRVQSFAVVPLLALSGSIGAIVSQNWGAKLPLRSQEAYRLAAGFCLFYGIATAIALIFAADYLASLFSDDAAVTEQFADYLAITSWGYAGFGLLIVSNGALNAIGFARLSLYQSAARVFLVMLPAAWLLQPRLGETGVFIAELSANLAGGLLAVLVVRSVFVKKVRKPAAR